MGGSDTLYTPSRGSLSIDLNQIKDTNNVKVANYADEDTRYTKDKNIAKLMKI